MFAQQARLAGGLWQLSTALLLAAALAAAPAAATFYQTNPKCWDGSKPDCSSTGPIRTNCYSGATSLQQLFGSWSKLFDCDDADWTSLSNKCGSGSQGFTAYGFIKIDSDDTYDFSLGGSGGSAEVLLDDDDSFLQSELSTLLQSAAFLPRLVERCLPLRHLPALGSCQAFKRGHAGQKV